MDQVAKDWKQRGYSCDVWTDPPGQVWENFVHPVDELLMVLDGELEVELEGKVLHPSPGEEVFIPAQALHSVRNHGDRTARWLYGYRNA